MSLASLTLVLLAAALHAGWNVLGKRGQDPFMFLWLAFGLGALAFSPWVALAALDGTLTAASAPYLIGTCSVHAVYFFSLGQAYRFGDFSRVYPIARGLGVALVPVLALVFLGERLSAVGYAGIALVVLGIVAVHRARAPGAPVPLGRGTAWALVTGLCVGAYSTIDKAGVGTVGPIPYLSVLGLGCCVLLSPVVIAGRDRLVREWRANHAFILVAAAFSIVAYLLVLYAFRLSKAGYVVAGRESSIVLSAFIGSLWLKEGPLRPRLLGSGVILVGVVFIALAE